MKSDNDSKATIGKIEKVIGSYHQELRRLTQARKDFESVLIGIGTVAEQMSADKLRREAIAEIEAILDMPAPGEPNDPQ